MADTEVLNRVWIDLDPDNEGRGPHGISCGISLFGGDIVIVFPGSSWEDVKSDERKKEFAEAMWYNLHHLAGSENEPVPPLFTDKETK